VRGNAKDAGKPQEEPGINTENADQTEFSSVVA